MIPTNLKSQQKLYSLGSDVCIPCGRWFGLAGPIPVTIATMRATRQEFERLRVGGCNILFFMLENPILNVFEFLLGKQKFKILHVSYFLSTFY